MALSRTGRIVFFSWLLAASFFGYGKLAFQDPQGGQPGGEAYKYRAGFAYTDDLSPWERLQAQQRRCYEANIMRGVLMRRDGEADDLRDTCIGDQVLRLERLGGVLNPEQKLVASAAKDYAMQRRYYYIALFFVFVGLAPLLYGRVMGFWKRWGKSIISAARYVQNVISKMM